MRLWSVPAFHYTTLRQILIPFSRIHPEPSQTILKNQRILDMVVPATQHFVVQANHDEK
jgi:hypothetical protein